MHSLRREDTALIHLNSAVPATPSRLTFIVHADSAEHYGESSYRRGVDVGFDLVFGQDVTIEPSRGDGLPTVVGLGVRARCFERGEQFTIYSDDEFVNGRAFIAKATHTGRFLHYMLVPRSSIAKTPLSLANSVGIIDAGYVGELKVALRNHSDKPWLVSAGTALFQLVAPAMEEADVIVVTKAGAIFDPAASARGARGFGSSGSAGGGHADDASSLRVREIGQSPISSMHRRALTDAEELVAATRLRVHLLEQDARGCETSIRARDAITAYVAECDARMRGDSAKSV